MNSELLISIYYVCFYVDKLMPSYFQEKNKVQVLYIIHHINNTVLCYEDIVSCAILLYKYRRLFLEQKNKYRLFLIVTGIRAFATCKL